MLLVTLSILSKSDREDCFPWIPDRQLKVPGKNSPEKGSLGRRGRYLQQGWQMSVREEQKEPSETAFISRVSLRILNALLNHWLLTAVCHRKRIIAFQYKVKFTTGLEKKYISWKATILTTYLLVKGLRSWNLLCSLGFSGTVQRLPEWPMRWMITLALAHCMWSHLNWK